MNRTIQTVLLAAPLASLQAQTTYARSTAEKKLFSHDLKMVGAGGEMMMRQVISCTHTMDAIRK
jgi:hypothetical protein